MKKIFSIILSALLFLSPALVFADDALSELETSRIRLNDQLELFSGSYYNAAAEGPLAENYMVYTPGETVLPSVCFGNYVTGAAGFVWVSNMEAEAGNRVVAGSNGDFFTMSTGVAMGLIIKNGEIYSSERLSCESIGFMEDGSVIIGRPGLNVSIADESAGVYYSNLCFNKNLTADNGLVVYSKRFGDSNGASASRNVLIRIDEGEPVPGGTMRGRVEAVEHSDAPYALPEGYIVLSVSENTIYTSILSGLARMETGDIVSIRFDISEEWLGVLNAIGGEKRLVRDGVISELNEGPARAPRTAAGIRADGSFVIYTADGRNSAHSRGLSYDELARRMLALGCVQAINLDGGDSTQMHAIYPGTDGFSQVNISSGTSLRRCANYLCFVNKGEQTGILAHLHLYPYSARLLAGAGLPLRLLGSDSAYYPVDVTGRVPVYSMSVDKFGGISPDGVFTSSGKGGKATISAYLDGASGSAEIEVISRPDELILTLADGSPLPERLMVYAGESLEIKVSAIYKGSPLISDEACFTRAVSEGLGSIENGVFTAADIDWMDGMLTVLAGEFGKSIPLTVYKDYDAPEISGSVADGFFTATVIDLLDKNFGKSGIELKYDGENIEFSYSAESGALSALLPPGDGELHHLVLYAADTRGNRSRMGFEVPTVSSAEDYVKEYVFSDMDAENSDTPYAEYLYRNGIMAGKMVDGVRLFDPAANLSRQEFAAVLCNWLLIDTANYQEIELPFTDIAEISEWAVPFVRAVYATGHMAGRAAPDGSLRFDPLGSISRQEVMTVLSKLLGDGYASLPLSEEEAALVAPWALSFVEKAVSNGVLASCEGPLRPTEPVVRGELARMIYAMD